MFIDESVWLEQVLARLKLAPGSRLLDIGSSTLDFRTVVQPHIDQHVFAPLRAQGVEVSHLDARAEPGVDIVADVATLAGVGSDYDVAICTSLLEHVLDRDHTTHNICRVIKPGGVLILTVPLRYPIHLDPIDTGFRPTPVELRQLVPWTDVIESSSLTIREPAHYQGKRWIRRYLAPWQISCLVARKPRTAEATS
jgi:SAM-dependent methyltransferase